MVNERPWAGTPDGLALTVRLTPKGGRDVIDGIERMADGRAVLKCRVRAAASEGAANAALIRLIAAAADVAPSRVTLTGGATARVKQLMIFGDVPMLIVALEKSCAGGLTTSAERIFVNDGTYHRR